MLRVDCSHVIYKFSPENEPAAKARPGEEIVFETRDCFSNQIRTERDLLESVNWNEINPATGPVYIEGVHPGDTLKVVIEDIAVKDRGVMTTAPGEGALGYAIEYADTKIIPVENNVIAFNDKIMLPTDPMIGVIGTAPAYGEIPCGTPGRHGGNMDTRLIKKGAILYLPVFIEGAMLAMGDLHALMGDGEVSVCGLEIPGEVTVMVDVIKNRQEQWPVLETPSHWYIIASGESLDEGASLAAAAMLDMLKSRVPMSTNDLINLLSIAGSMEVCQVVDPLKTVRMGISKRALQNYNFAY